MINIKQEAQLVIHTVCASVYFFFGTIMKIKDGQQCHQIQQSKQPPLIIEQNKDHKIWHLKSRAWLGTGKQNVAGLNHLMGSQLSTC